MAIKLSDGIIKTCAKYGVDLSVCDTHKFANMSSIECSSDGILIHYGVKQANSISSINNDTFGRYIIYVRSNFNTNHLNLNAAIEAALCKIIKEYDCVKPENKLISQNVIDYCNKWDVEVINIVDELYNYFKSEFNTGSTPFCDYFSIDWKRKIIYAKCHTDSDLINALKIPPFEYKDKNKTLLHELTHILMIIRPEYINEFTSPFFSAWVLNLKACGISLTEEKKKSILLHTPYNQNKELYGEDSFDNFISDRIPELVKAGIFNEDGSPTFKLKNIKPELSWVNLNSLLY